ncbi:hypothetical protein WESB_2132 [Brachyspira pilosicoli WesB]|uniref:Uncharacterized protein n=3 Tax=Brachyspira pilosicoli TaxID=52584 RepID=K0JMK5_BRAPL|nr:hypothetical protein [Brachyspira pilosicoli]AFR71532.1 hypothetical protein B2904_orf2204 [Brachyspira pilosicoli B2904]PLV57715.1 hypothetical protein BPSP16_09955 [Brachyspira pilosicoli SP16]CCG57596.1 hypothetical protein WESB_2132 [Brachyspira pilosicoli WesB]
MENFEQLYDIIDNNMCKFILLNKDDIFNIKDKNSEMEINIKLRYKSICSKDIEGEKKFNHLKIKKCADAVIIRKNKNNNLDLHIIELKKDIHDDKLTKFSDQYFGAYLRIISVLLNELKIENIYLYLIYDKLLKAENIDSTNKNKNITYNRDLFYQCKIYNSFHYLNISFFDLKILNIIKYNLQDNTDIVI